MPSVAGGRDGTSVGEGEEGGGADSGRRSVQIFSPCRWEIFFLLAGGKYFAAGKY